MKIIVTIETDSEAFQDDYGSEVSCLLRELADRVEGADMQWYVAHAPLLLHDRNGAWCGDLRTEKTS